MKRNMLQSIVITALLAVTLMIGNVAPTAASVFKCEYYGELYDLGEKRNAVGPLGGYFQCEMIRINQPGGVILMRPGWVWHPDS